MELAFHPALEAQTGDPAEVALVVGHQGEAVRPGCRGDEDIKVFYERFLPAQIRFDLAEQAGYLRTEGEGVKATEEIVDGLVILCGSRGVCGTVSQFGQRDHRNRKCLCAIFSSDAGDAVAQRIMAAQPERARISVEEESHSAGASVFEDRAS